MKKTVYDGISEILATKKFNAISVMVKADGVESKKLVRGTIVGGDTGKVLTDDSQLVVDKNTALLGKDAEGVLLHDVDLSDGDVVGTMIIRGEVDLGKLEALDITPVEEVVETLNSRILFIK